MVRRKGMRGAGSLFAETQEAAREEIAPGAFVLRGFALSMETAVLGALRATKASHSSTPSAARRLSVGTL